ncbi:MAG: Carbon monoxide dehydrogenase small chain [Alphaproteobacteria bacterium MarineAlpha3_Bin5]|nr:carbon monoxide dehydrogenase [Magnetovibrio sp.]PPR76979.1 MAG: Carbon monoxide dehydrogenase small chain [Alphaproteobacteria bacterium MarineAlpha3_Bin5]|tara:strand:+ start:645 stop:1118 length:474 start_codon:yes stop_codon:yes gene_type:complete
MTRVSLEVNGKKTSIDIPDNTLLSTFLREHLNLKGTHIGCDTSQCGACVVIVNGKTVKSCTMLALQAAGSRVETVESLCDDGKLHPMQRAFHEYHALQCGFCTPGMLMTAVALAKKGKEIDELSVRTELEGNLCRCTGYQNIVAAILAGAKKMRTQT